MRPVILESPFAGDRDRNTLYARRAVRDCLLRGDAPIASHLLFPQPGILDEDIEAERDWGIKAGHTWIPLASALVVYQDYNISKGMNWGIGVARKHGVPVEYRNIGENP